MKANSPTRAYAFQIAEQFRAYDRARMTRGEIEPNQESFVDSDGAVDWRALDHAKAAYAARY